MMPGGGACLKKIRRHKVQRHLLAAGAQYAGGEHGTGYKATSASSASRRGELPDRTNEEYR
jgi:hypothetical protein